MLSKACVSLRQRDKNMYSSTETLYELRPNNSISDHCIVVFGKGLNIGLYKAIEDERNSYSDADTSLNHPKYL